MAIWVDDIKQGCTDSEIDGLTRTLDREIMFFLRGCKDEQAYNFDVRAWLEDNSECPNWRTTFHNATSRLALYGFIRRQKVKGMPGSVYLLQINRREE